MSFTRVILLFFVCIYFCTLGSAYNEQQDAQETVRSKQVLMLLTILMSKKSAPRSRVLVVTELFNITANTVNDFDAKKICSL